MENFDELDIEELTDDELDLVSGGWMTQLIHMDYHNMNNFNDPTAPTDNVNSWNGGVRIKRTF